MSNLPIKIKATGAVILTPELSSFVEEKIGKLEKLIDPSETTALMEIELESIPDSRDGDLFRAELNFSSNGKVLRVEAKRPTLHAAVSEMVEETSRRLRHLKTKRRDLTRRGAAKVKEFFRKFGK